MPRRLLLVGMVGLACFGVLLWCAYDGVRLLMRHGPGSLWSASPLERSLGLRMLGDLAGTALGAAAVAGCGWLAGRVTRPAPASLARPSIRAEGGAVAMLSLAFAVPLTALDAVMNPPITAWTFVPGIGGALVIFIALTVRTPGD